MSTLAPVVIDRARSQVGYVETHRNITRYWSELNRGLQGAPWCGAYAAWVWKEAGFDLRPHCNPYSASALRSWARKIGAYKTSSPKAGDIVLYGFGDSKLEHIGIAWPDPEAKGFRALEGNTSPGSRGSQANGGQVAVRYRGRRSIDGWIDMDTVLRKYTKAGAGVAAQVGADVTGALVTDGIGGARTVKELQRRLGVPVDGKAGPATIKALQAYLGTPQDGKLTGQSKHAHDAIPAAWASLIVTGDGGSKAVRYLQAYVGAKVDGRLGPDTMRRVQGMCNQWASAFTAQDRVRVAQRAKAAGL